jgi:SagB-type dehydrogenase family enzyme
VERRIKKQVSAARDGLKNVHREYTRESAQDEVSPRALNWMHRLLSSYLSRRGFIGLLLGGVGGILLGKNWQSEAQTTTEGDIGELYHEWSKPSFSSLFGTIAEWGNQPKLYKNYPEAEEFSLPSLSSGMGMAVESAIQERRSIRNFSDEPMTLDELSSLLHFSDGISAERWGVSLRMAPSAGALYPIEIYPVLHLVEGMLPGLYHYSLQDHALELLRLGDLRAHIVRCGLMQDFLGQANLVLVMTAIFQRLRWKYRERSYRYAMLEAGHIGQNIYLLSTSMGLGACAVGAFLDDELNAFLGVDGRTEAAIYMLAVGKPSS